MQYRAHPQKNFNYIFIWEKPLEEILERLRQNHNFVPTGGRLALYLTLGTTCQHCGLQASVAVYGGGFKKLPHGERQMLEDRHLDFYGIDKNGWYVPLTIDHIKPKSKGGASDISNYQVLCLPCNRKKGNKWKR